MNIQKVKKLKADITYLKANRGIVAVDEENRVYFFDENEKFVKGFNFKLPKHKKEENSVDVSYDNRYVLIAIPSKGLYLFDLKLKKKQQFNWHKGDVTCCKFFDGGYFGSGGVDGHIYLYALDLRKRVASLPKHKDFVMDLEFISSKDTLVAGGYDNSVIFVDVSSFKRHIRYPHLKPTKKVMFNNYLVTTSTFSDIIKWIEYDDVDRFKLYKEFRDFEIVDNILVIGVEGKIVLYDLEKEVLLNEEFLKVDVEKISVYKNWLYFSFEDTIFKVNLLEDEDKLISLIAMENYKEVYELVLKNPFLKKTKAYEELEEIYKEKIKEAIKYFEALEDDMALNILRPFLEVPSLKFKIEKIINDFKNFAKFKLAYEKKNYALLYQLAYMYPNLQKTKIFELVEKEWEKRVDLAFKYAIKGRIEDAKEVLKPFMGVAKKIPLIKKILQEAGKYKLLKEKLVKRDFKGFCALIKENPEFKDTKEYRILMEYAENLYKKALELLKKEDFKRVVKIIHTLKDIEKFKDKALELEEKLKIVLEFIRAFKSDKNKAFELVEKYPFLRELSVFREYESIWKDKLKLAQRKAFEGKLKEALDELKEYKGIEAKKARISSMIKSAYLEYVNSLKGDKKQEAIEKYKKKFGEDEEIKKLS